MVTVFPNQLLLVSQAVNSKGQHSISYTLSRNHTVVVEYSHDDDTDMFQVGVIAPSPPPLGFESCHTFKTYISGTIWECHRNTLTKKTRGVTTKVFASCL